jgi:hypothetical protein
LKSLLQNVNCHGSVHVVFCVIFASEHLTQIILRPLSVLSLDEVVTRSRRPIYFSVQEQNLQLQRHLIHQYIHIETVVQLSCNKCPNIHSCMFTDFPGDY